LNRRDLLNPIQLAFFDQLKDLYEHIDDAFIADLDRSVSFGDVFVDRWERASKLGFGERTNIYDSSLVIGDVKVGTDCWIGPYTILDGSGGLDIGDYTTISSGAQLYTHDNIKSTLSSGILPVERKSCKIGNNCYLAPNALITKGVRIGNFCVIAANSFVNESFPDYSIIAGVPAKQIGLVKFEGDNIEFEFFKK
jgi:acetyltransferase-like isoleucine patch superfamily enzyme